MVDLISWWTLKFVSSFFFFWVISLACFFLVKMLKIVFSLEFYCCFHPEIRIVRLVFFTWDVVVCSFNYLHWFLRQLWNVWDADVMIAIIIGREERNYWMIEAITLHLGNIKSPTSTSYNNMIFGQYISVWAILLHSWASFWVWFRLITNMVSDPGLAQYIIFYINISYLCSLYKWPILL